MRYVCEEITEIEDEVIGRIGKFEAFVSSRNINKTNPMLDFSRATLQIAVSRRILYKKLRSLLTVHTDNECEEDKN